LPARIEFWPHEPENGRTERFIAARKWKLSAQIDFEAAGNDCWPHEWFEHRRVDHFAGFAPLNSAVGATSL
jgi:hypothetical protein